VKGKPLELALRPLQDGEGAFYSEAPAGTGNTLVSIANPLILTGDKASRFIKDAKFRQRTMQKARDLQKDGVIAHGKTQVGDQTVRDSVYAPLDQAQVRTNGRPDPTALEAPRVISEYDGPEPAIPAEMLSEGQGDAIGEIKFSKWEELGEFLQDRDESRTLDALQRFAGKLTPQSEEGKKLQASFTEGVTADQYQALGVGFSGALSDLDSVSSPIENGFLAVLSPENSPEVLAAAEDLLISLIERAGIDYQKDRFAQQIPGLIATLKSADKDSAEYQAALSDLVGALNEYNIISYESALPIAKQIDSIYGLVSPDLLLPSEQVKGALASVVGYEYLGSDTMISERGAYEQAVLRQSFEDAGLEAPRVNGMDAAYMAAVEAGDTETAQRAVDVAAERAGYTLGNLYHGTTAEFDVFDPSKSGSKLTRDVGAIFLSMSEDFAKEYPTRSNIGLNKEDVRVIRARVKPGRVFDPANNPEVIEEFLADGSGPRAFRAGYEGPAPWVVVALGTGYAATF